MRGSGLNDSPRPDRVPSENVEAADGLPQPRRTKAVITVGLGLMMAVLDGAIANLALPTIAHDFAISPAASIWIVNAYQLALVMTLLPFAALGDQFGFRRVYLIGMTVFTVSSLGCALSHTLTELTVARVIQGFGAAGMMSVNSALVRYAYPRAMLGRGFSINMMIGSSSSALGPTVAAAILSVGGWQWLFAINVPIGLLVLAMGRKTLPHTPLSGGRFDLGSAALNAVTFGLLINGIEAFGHGESRVVALLQLAAAVVTGGLLARRQMSRPAPMLPVDLLARPIFALSVVASVCSFAAQAAAVVVLPFYFQITLGLSQGRTGLLMTPWPLSVALVAQLAGSLSDRFSAAVLGGLGQAMMCAGLISLALLPDEPSALNIIWRLCLCGVGFGLFNAPNNKTMVGSVPKSRSSGASGMQATSRLFGQSLGTALVAVLFALMTTGGTPAALSLAACFSFMSGVASVLRPRRRQAAAAR
jgi:DHA2 family multidrug resistance protein-like MFS transporter